ncbi:NADH-quinone oxidoreductase subunit C [Thermococcus argininiproducens]|uniref:NADH-quinone oxidoreductase subunit C n=1 Tax=Thermococcus argininiproducens TaxID=2866384 RepID=A0A9E7M9V2_9EURY|nr:NADH-quinone oxidoreductase subunit C [Thermococcus argininiproducens]USG99735.1 NADH-quinone oxidoreductase subunit C [Thermococcus argininiproducens]
MTPEELIKKIKERFEVETHISQTKTPYPRKRIWIGVDRENFKSLMKCLQEIDPHAQFSIIIGEDRGDYLSATYHLELFCEEEPSLSVAVTTTCPKESPKIPSLGDVFPSSVPYERENQEFLGIVFEGIPDPRRLFLPDDFPEGVYPLRLDETGITPEMVKNAGHPYKVKKEGSQ